MANTLQSLHNELQDGAYYEDDISDQLIKHEVFAQSIHKMF